jgi:hypothetical protein
VLPVPRRSQMGHRALPPLDRNGAWGGSLPSRRCRRDGMIVAAWTTLLAESRSGCRGGMLLWALLVPWSIASLAAKVAVAEPALIGRVIAVGSGASIPCCRSCAAQTWLRELRVFAACHKIEPVPIHAGSR